MPDIPFPPNDPPPESACRYALAACERQFVYQTARSSSEIKTLSKVHDLVSGTCLFNHRAFEYLCVLANVQLVRMHVFSDFRPLLPAIPRDMWHSDALPLPPPPRL